MKKIFYPLFTSLIIVSLINTASAQTQNAYETAIKQFQTDYNAQQYQNIFKRFSPKMQQALPLTKTEQFLNGLQQQAGAIKRTKLIEQQQNHASYKTDFTKTTLTINLSLDQQNKINGLYIKPYQQPSKAQNELQDYPKEIAELIFSKTQNLPNKAQLAIAIVKGNQVNHYGVIKQNNTIKPYSNQNKVFEIGSISKVFTSIVLASLVKDKKIKLTDNINKFYPFSFKNNQKINFIQLANHSSGLPRLPENLDLSSPNNPYKNYGQKQLKQYLTSILELQQDPGYSYSNLGAGLLGHTLGLSQKIDFKQLLKTTVFDKYQMHNSFTGSTNLKNKPVKGLDPNGNNVSNWDFDVLFGAGGILSTSADLAKFAQAQFNPQNQESALTQQPTLQVNQTTKIGLAWHIIQTKDGKELLWHNGGTGGYSSSITIDTKTKTAVIILSNVSQISHKIDNLCFDLMTLISRYWKNT